MNIEAEARATLIGIAIAFLMIAVGVATVLIQRRIRQDVKPGTMEAKVVDLLAG
jgi:hypothetical protein